MSQNSTGQNDTAAQHTLGELIAGGITVHLLDTALAYTDGATEVSNKSVKSYDIAEADLTTVSATDFTDTATLQNANEEVIDVASNTATVVEVAIQNQTNTGRVVLADETNDPDLSELDEYTIAANTTLYELGNPT